MPISKAQQKSVNKYVKENYDRINITMPKGRKDIIQSHAAICAQSVNAYINSAIDEKIARAGAETPAGTSEQSAAVPISPTQENATQTISAQIQAHIEKTGENETAFLKRAAESTIKRDNISLEMGINPATGEKMKEEEPHE